MKSKIFTYLALVPLVVLALTPPWNFQLDCTINSLFWLWTVFFSGFLTFLFLYQRVSVWLKLFLIWCYINCFISRAPYLSFTMFWSVVVCAYYYVLCLKIEDFAPVRKTIQTIFFFITLLIVMQCFGLDTLLNFNQKVPVVLGTIGNKMVLGSYVCVLAPFLVFNPLNWVALALISFISGSSGTIFAVLAGLGFYSWKKFPYGKAICIFLITSSLIIALKTGDIYQFDKAGRFPVWKRTVELVLKRPVGYGPATNRLLFPILSQDLKSSEADVGEWDYENTHGKGLAWRRTHNDFLQILFEVGFPGFILFAGWIGSIIWKVRKNILKLTGFIIIGTNMLTAFPQRMTQSVLILLIFLAYCEFNDNVYVAYSKKETADA